MLNHILTIFGNLPTCLQSHLQKTEKHLAGFLSHCTSRQAIDKQGTYAKRVFPVYMRMTPYAFLGRIDKDSIDTKVEPGAK